MAEEYEHVFDDDLGLMTNTEKEIVKDLGMIFNKIQSVMGTDVPADVREACNHIHALQNMIISCAGRRAYPQLFRMLGEYPTHGDANYE